MLLTAVMLITMLPVNVEAKKLGKIPMGDASANPSHWLWGEDETTIDFPHGLDNWRIDRDLNCKPGDTFTFVLDDRLQTKVNFYNGCLNTKTDGKVFWHTTDPDVATVNKNGKVTVKSEGNAAITACIKVTSKGILGGEWTTEEYVLYRHWIHSGPVLQLKKGNVKAVARNAHAIIKRDRFPVVRAKGSPEETKELFQSFVKEYNKLGHNARGEIFQEIGNFTYWW